MKRLISFLLVVVMALSVPFTAFADTVTTVVACSDFQNPSGNESGAKAVQGLLKSTGLTSADGFLCCGDYNYGNGATSDGINALKSAVSGIVSKNMVFVRGNHDEAVTSNVGLSKSGNNDTDAYGVYVIHETDYMRTNSNEIKIQYTAQYLINYLNAKLEEGYTKPVFVVSHLPLHYTMRTRQDGDGMHAKYIFDALNEAGSKGLNIIFMYGHDHSNGWDDYLGGSAVYLKKGDNIFIAQHSKTVFSAELLKFTYMNAGFVGYYENRNGADDALTMTTFKITDSAVEVVRYDKNGIHNLKSAGVTNSYKNESAYSPDKTVYTSPQTVELTKVTNKNPISDLLDIPDPNKTEGDKFVKVNSPSELKDGGKYLLVRNSSLYHIMMPKVVKKSNGSTYRQGFDIVECTGVGEDAYALNKSTGMLWTFTKSSDGWLIGDGAKYARFTPTTDMSVIATLENSGEKFTISGGDGAFNFYGGGYYLNYNSRGLINGFASDPVPFYVYEYVGSTVFVEGGTADKKSAKAGESVTITASVPDDSIFDKWVYVTGSGYIDDLTSAQVTFTMPEGPVKVKATYKEKPHTHTYTNDCDAICNGCGVTRDITHAYGEYLSDGNATTEADGTKTRTCSVCGAKDTVTDVGSKLPVPEPEIKDTSKIFNDIKAKGWYKAYVDYAVAYGIFTGTSASTFSPNDNITRAQFVQVLANIEGVDTSNRNVKTSFSDVPAKKWFTAAVKWASENKIVNGVGDGKFDPNANVTREQMCVMLVNFAKFKNITLKAAEGKENFADDKSISKWAKTAVYTCQMADIVNGKGEGKFDPQGTGTRAEASVIFTKFHKDYM